TKNKQDPFLSTLIHIKAIARHRPANSEEQARLNNCSYVYNVRVRRQDQFQPEVVCHKAFLLLFGITNHRVQSIKQALVFSDVPFNNYDSDKEPLAILKTIRLKGGEQLQHSNHQGKIEAYDFTC
ncbi:hypothetical protein RRG08_005772, partial [Elysia crispata]